MTFSAKKFKDCDLSDPFFESLRVDYDDFDAWFDRKADSEVYVKLETKQYTTKTISNPVSKKEMYASSN